MAGPACTVGSALLELSDDDRVLFAGLGQQHTVRVMAAALSAASGMDISIFTLRRHLRGDCRCTG